MGGICGLGDVDCRSRFDGMEIIGIGRVCGFLFLRPVRFAWVALLLLLDWMISWGH